MNTITNIPAGNYQGYIWMSDQPRPMIVDGPFEGAGLVPSNPFIIEARLFDTTNGISYTVCFIDGEYRVSSCIVDQLPEGEMRAYIPSFDNAPGKLLFFTAWREQADPLCEGMPVLVPCENVFVGFKK